jgi:hypothetical protein
MASAILNAAPGNEKFGPLLKTTQLSQNTIEINITKFPDTVKAVAGLNTEPGNKAIHTHIPIPRKLSFSDFCPS